jgi:hypothetical protein
MKIRSLLIATALLITIVILVLQRSQISKLTADLQAARPAADSVPETSANTSATPASPAAASEESAELLRLRAEVTALRKQTNELTKVRGENAQMRAALAATGKTPMATQDQSSSDREQAQAVARLGESRVYGLALILHLQDNERFATNMEELRPYLGSGAVTGTNEFDIMLQGTREGLTNAAGTILVREHQPRQRADGRWTRAYGFLDGHSELHTEPTSNFDDFERQHMWPPSQ